MPAQHAGFAAAVAIGERALNTLAKVLYFTPGFSRKLTLSMPGDPGEPNVTFAPFFLAPPRFVFLSANQGKIVLVFAGHAAVTVGDKSCDCDVEMHVALPSSLHFHHAKLTIKLDALGLSLDFGTVRPLSPSSFSSGAQAYLDSSSFRRKVGFLLAFGLLAKGDILPPFDVSFLGAVATDASTTATLVVVDGALVVGLDIASGGVTTAGVAGQLSNFLGDHDIAMWTNPLAAPLAFASMRSTLETEVQKEKATLQSYSLLVEEGGFRVNGTAGNASGTVSFSFLAVPVLEKSGDPLRDRLSVRLTDPNVTTQPAWWVGGLGIISAGIAIAIVEFSADVVRRNLANQIRLNPGPDVAPLTIHFTLPNVKEPEVTLRIVAFACHVDGVFVGLRVEVPFRRAKVVGPAAIAADDVPALATSPLVYRADLGFDAVDDDPSLRARWTVRVPRSTASLLVQDSLVASGGDLLRLDGANVDLLSSLAFDVACRLYRARGATAEELLDQALTLSVQERLDRTHPFVRWTHQALVPVVRREQDGSKTILGAEVKTRKSKLHRTAIPGRCRMVSHYSQEWIDLHVGPTIQYLDALPFLRADLIAHRRELCDYCFFGGPTKTVPLIP